MQPPRPGEAGIKRGIENTGGLAQTDFGMFGGKALEEIFGRDAGPAAEEAVEMGLAKPGGGGEVAKRRLSGEMFVEVTNHCGDTVIIIHKANLAERKDKPTRFLQ